MSSNSSIDNVPKPTSRPVGERAELVGSTVPEPPFPIRIQGQVEKGFGRGSKDLGCPTANLPSQNALKPGLEKNGIYFGLAKVNGTAVKEMVMSVGYCPVYGNTSRSVEIHVLHDFGRDFYGENLRAIVLGYIRPEYNYTSKDALISDIETDKKVAKNSMAREGYQVFAQDEFFNDD
ncbi:hypothetical protein CROQUDRAFT_657388 [Cronartium quercuum f. sp. fusiforme G11]|uniref:Riboflavin kinase n=1 Tax=Cronartium quercuum f. sp. fusiforme G11 TaxID=708437 RepID=A0A9P6NI48_9BASI|nr:hypothetical protein CROQUDRAFT_657388 [Cronartium quercuum f. sp. fusiforme G11]